MKRPWLSGFCSPDLPRDSHARCDEHPRHDGKPCACSCHEETTVTEVHTVPTTPQERGGEDEHGSQILAAHPGGDLKAGLHFDLPEADYHGQRASLSVSGAKKLLPPSCPAKFKAALEAGEEHKPQFDFGKVAHALVLGKGADFEVAPYEDWRSKAAREFRDEAYEAGRTPILATDHTKALELAAAVAAHPLAGALFSGGEAEVSAAWTDPTTGVHCRARFDYLPEKIKGRRLVVPDLKTALSAQPGEFGRSAGRFHYAMQDQWYTDAARALDLDDDPAFLFVVVEKEPPYIVTVGQLREEDKKLGRALNDKARRIYAECLATDMWPAYTRPDEIAEIALPVWHHNDYEEVAYS